VTPEGSAADPINELDVLEAFVDAYAVPNGQGQRRSILFVKYMGGCALQHHAAETWPPYDEGTIDRLYRNGLISRDGQDSFIPSERAEARIAQYKRSRVTEPVADTAPIFDAVRQQSEAENVLAWPVVLPVLAALRDYWTQGGLAPTGIAMTPLVTGIPDDLRKLFATTIRVLVDADYLSGAKLTIIDTPVEVGLTSKSRSVLDGWPGAAPSDLVENLLAVLTEKLRDETDPAQRNRWQSLLDLVKELGVGVTSEVLAKVLTGGHG
jgi:hypothetical protein